jgi:syntaxin 16
MSGGAGPAEEDEDDFDLDRGFSEGQQDQVRDNTNIVRGREKEITKIVESIHELAEIFKDLANLVVEQGTMVDRIDYNIEMTATSIEKGYEELEKAEKYQASATKKRIIMFLVLICVLFFFIEVFSSHEDKTNSGEVDHSTATTTTLTYTSTPDTTTTP